MTDRATVPTQIGPFTAIVDGEGRVLASGWTEDVDRLLGLIHPSLRPGDVRERAELGAVTDAVAAYHGGDLGAIDGIEVVQRSGEFLERVWDTLRATPAGAPVTYTELAAKAGRANAVRAAGSACARNATSLFVPCHRALRTDGSLGGFGWGLDLKRWLLAHERAG